jgi:hypothetical protein
MKSTTDNQLWFIYGAVMVAVLPGCIASILDAGEAIYRQVILKEPYGIQIKVTPDMLKPAEGIEWSQHYCGLRLQKTLQAEKKIA